MQYTFIITNAKFKEQAILTACTEDGARSAVKLVRPQWEEADLEIHAVLPGTVLFRKI